MVLVAKISPPNSGDVTDVGLIPGFGRCLGKGNSNPFQYSCLENPLDRGAWQGNHRVAESDTTEATKHNKPKKVGSHCFKV